MLKSNGADKEIAIRDKEDEGPVAQIDLSGSLGKNTEQDHLRDTMFAVAMAYSLGHSAKQIHNALVSLELGLP